MMTETRTTFQTLATEFASAFQTGTRTSGETYVFLRDDAPDWLGDKCGPDVLQMIHAAVDDRGPDDWTYSITSRSAESIAEYESADDAQDRAYEIADSLVDIYTHSLLEWAAAPNNYSLCEEAAEQYGLPEPFSLAEYVQRGQLLAIERIVSEAVRLIACEAEQTDDSDD